MRTVIAIALSIFLPALGLVGIGQAHAEAVGPIMPDMITAQAGSYTATPAPNVRVLVDGQPVDFDVPLVMVGGRVLVPLRGVFERLGATVVWDDQTQTALAETGTSSVSLAIGAPQATINGIATMLDVPPMLVGGRTMVPLRFVSQALGANVDWDAPAQSVVITTQTAQPAPPPVQPSGLALQGTTLQAVDCQAGTVVLNTDNGTDTFFATNDATAVVNSTTIPLCGLQDYEYAGAPVMVGLVSGGNQLLVSQLSFSGPIGYTPPATQTVSPLPLWGVVLGTIFVGGLLYLLAAGPDGYYYRYPYYGPYHRYYYRPAYQPYVGRYPQPASIVVVTVAQPIVGVVLGRISVNNYQYLVTRDDTGHFYRYPYYGPYRPYYAVHNANVTNVRVINVTNVTNVYVNAQVRAGDARWDPPAVRTTVQENHKPVLHNVPPQQLQSPLPSQPAYFRFSDSKPGPSFKTVDECAAWQRGQRAGGRCEEGQPAPQSRPQPQPSSQPPRPVSQPTQPQQPQPSSPPPHPATQPAPPQPPQPSRPSKPAYFVFSNNKPGPLFKTLDECSAWQRGQGAEGRCVEGQPAAESRPQPQPSSQPARPAAQPTQPQQPRPSPQPLHPGTQPTPQQPQPSRPSKPAYFVFSNNKPGPSFKTLGECAGWQKEQGADGRCVEGSRP